MLDKMKFVLEEFWKANVAHNQRCGLVGTELGTSLKIKAVFLSREIKAIRSYFPLISY